MQRLTGILVLAALSVSILMAHERGVQAAPPLQLPWPSGEQHRINSGNQSYNCGLTHGGQGYETNAYAIDFEFLTIGLAVGAASTGQVSIASKGFNNGAGNYIEVDHGSGFKTRYLHLRSDADGGPWPSAIAFGAWVTPGPLMAYSGNTGGVAPHLHFDMKLSGVAYMPEPMSGIRGFDNYGLCVGTASDRWISRHATDVQRVTDGTGEGRDDAVVFWQGAGEWKLAPSSGSSFGTPTQWINGHGVGSNRQFAADVNGDFRTDAVVWFAGDGSWYVSLSTGSRYLPFTRWALGHGIGSTNQFLADVNVDGRADAVVFFEAWGGWYVSLSTGSSFGSGSLWATGHGINSSDQILADTTGDLRADAIVFFDVGPAGTGSWYVAPSTGSAFGTYSLWANGHGHTSDRRFVADVNGDLKGDAESVRTTRCSPTQPGTPETRLTPSSTSDRPADYGMWRRPPARASALTVSGRRGLASGRKQGHLSCLTRSLLRAII